MFDGNNEDSDWLCFDLLIYTDVLRAYDFCLMCRNSTTAYKFVYDCIQLNQNINAFQRKFVNEVRRCEEMERKLRTFSVSTAT